MTLWRAPVRSHAPLAPFWRALGRHNYGCDHFKDSRGWVFVVDRLERQRGEWARHRVGEWVADDEIDVIVQALPSLPSIGARLALLELLL